MNYNIKIGLYGDKHYYVNNVLHREDGPAVEYVNGTKIWYLNGKLYGYNNDFNNISWSKFVKTLIFS